MTIDRFEIESRNRRMMFDALKYWTPELIEWIGYTQDPVKLSVASCLINTRKWPEWMSSKPDWYDDMVMNGQKVEDYNIKLIFACEVSKMCGDKSLAISPELHNKIWLTKYYETYHP